MNCQRIFFPPALWTAKKAFNVTLLRMHTSMASDHPFQLLFETLARPPVAHADSVNRQAYEVLADILSVPLEKTGRCVLLRAPRAGHGKTHLLSRILHQLGASHEFIPLHASCGSRIDASSVIDDTLRRLVRQLPAGGGLTVLDLVTRRLFASALQPLVGSGEVPCQDREGALTALRARPIETFDFHHPNAVTAHWARENFEVLGQRLSLELAQRTDLPVSDVAFWVELLFRFAAAPLDNPGRVRALVDSVHAGPDVDMERLEALLGLLTLLMRVVLVADDLEGFSSDESSALRLAAFLGSLRQSVERLDVILSLNQDIWQSAFLPRLSGGLADRLSEVVVELEPLTQTEMAALLDSRVPGLGGRVLERIDIGAAGTHARGLIRAAGMAWLRATAMDSAPAAAITPSPSLTDFTPAPSVEMPLPQASPPAPEPEPVVNPEPPREEDFAAAWPAPAFEPVPLPEPISHPPTESPYQGEIPEPAAAAFEPVAWQETPSDLPEAPSVEPFPETPAEVARIDSPFQPETPSPPSPAEPFVKDPPFQFTRPPAEIPRPTPAPIFEPDPSQPPPPPPTKDTDRVDDLLRQFRERYGRGSL